MGLFDKISTDGTGTTAMFTQQAAAFAKMDLNAIFKMAGQGVASLITNAVSFFSDVFGHSDCNDQDRVLVERFMEQIPGMALLLSELGYLDSSIGDALRSDPNSIYGFMQLGRPKGAEPCNSLLYPSRLLLTLLFGVRIVNSNFLDALDRGVDDYYNAGGNWVWDIPRNAVERAVTIKQQFFPISTYNTQQWNLNRFQEFPLVAPIPDPAQPGQLYTGEFLGVKVVNGVAIGDPIPDIDDYTQLFDPRTGVHVKPGGITPITNLPGLPPTTETGTLPGTGTTPGASNGDLFNQAFTWAKAHPLETVGIIALVAVVASELLDD
jgi:hypothetical protein